MTHADYPPIPYPDLDSLSPPIRDAILQRNSLNVFRMLAHSTGLAPGVYSMVNDVFVKNSLPHPWREIAVLRVGYRYGATYEVSHHVVLGRAVGLTDAELSAAASGSTAGLSEPTATVLELTDRLLTNHTLDAADTSRALSVLTVEQLADLVITVGFYQLICNFLNTFEVMPEENDWEHTSNKRAAESDTPPHIPEQ